MTEPHWPGIEPKPEPEPSSDPLDLLLAPYRGAVPVPTQRKALAEALEARARR